MSNNELWDVYGFGVTLGCLYLGAQGCVLSTRDPPQNRGHIQTESEGLEKDFPSK